jgi:hypothetical protein
MYRHGILVAASCLLLAGCVDSPRLTAGFTAPAQAAEAEQDPAQKSFASKVLSAIALERVTGAKPDPSRLQDTR